MSEPLRVTHVVLSLDFGGLERVVLALVRAAAGFGQAASVVCLERPGTLAPQAEALGVPVVCVGKPPGLRWETTDHVRAVLRRLSPDVVHTHQITALLYAGRAARREHVPAVLHTEHTNVASRKPRSWARRLRAGMMRRYAASFADRFCGVSQDGLADAAAYWRVRQRKLVHVPNGVDTTAFADGDADRQSVREELSIPATAPVAGTVGRLAEVKLQDVLIRAFAQVLPVIPTAHLVLVGDGPLRTQLEQQVRDLGLYRAVHFAGYRPDPERYLAAMDVFALPSRAEAMPLVIPEAWAAGRPVVASRVGAIPGMFADADAGYLVEPGDVAGLADRLRLLLGDLQRAREMGLAGRRLARAKYDVAVMVGAYDRLYCEVLTQKKGPVPCAFSR
jgi:glycosyltransferase involved in cell wall biosynthesis